MKNLGLYKHFGDFLRALRMDREVTLREFCKKAAADPGNISRIERRNMPPPQDSVILERYAAALDIIKGSDEWYLFFDLAAADCGIIPRDLMSDAAVVKMLPVFFRTVRGERSRRKPKCESLWIKFAGVDKWLGINSELRSFAKRRSGEK